MADFNVGVNFNDNDAKATLDDIEQGIDDVTKASKKNNTQAKKNDAQAKKSVKNIKKLANEYKKLDKSLSLVSKGLGKAFKASAIGATVAMAGLTLQMKKFADLSDYLTTMSSVTGIATDKLQAYGYALVQVGYSLDGMQEMLQKVNIATGKVASGDKAMVKTFDKLGVSIKKSNGELKETSEIFDEIIINMGKMNAGDKSYAGGLVFGDRKAGSAIALSNSNFQQNLKTKMIIPKEQLESFASMKISLKNLVGMTQVHIAPYFSVISDGISNMADNIFGILHNTDPATQAEALKSISTGLGKFAFAIQEAMSNMWTTLGKALQDFGLITLTIGMKTIGLLGSIVTALGPLAIIGMTLDSVANLLGTAIDYISIINPFSSASQISGQKNLNNRASQAYKDKNKKLQVSIDMLVEAIKSGEMTSKESTKARKELVKLERERRSNVARIGALSNGATPEYKRLAKDAEKWEAEIKRYEAQRSLSGGMTTEAIQQIPLLQKELDAIRKDLRVEASKTQATVGEITKSLVGDVITVGLTVAGLSLTKWANKTQQTANRMNKVRTGTTKRPGVRTPTPRQQKLNNQATATSRNASILSGAGNVAKSAILLSPLIDIYNQLKTMGNFDELSIKTEAEWTDIFAGALSKVTSTTGSKPSGATPPKIDLKEKPPTETPDESTVDALGTGWLQRLFGVSDEAQAMADARIGLFQDTNDKIMDLANGFVDLAVIRDQKELDSWVKKEQLKVDASVMSDRTRADQQKKLDEETEKRQKEINKKQARMQIANTWVQALSGSAMAFAQAAGTIPPPAGPIIGGINAGLVLGMAGVNTAKIASQSFANSGFVGATGGKDNQMVNAKEGELFLNGRDQVSLLEKLRSKTNDLSVNIENFNGNDEDLSRLQEMLYTLMSNGQINDSIFA